MLDHEARGRSGEVAVVALAARRNWVVPRGQRTKKKPCDGGGVRLQRRWQHQVTLAPSNLRFSDFHTSHRFQGYLFYVPTYL